MGGCCPLVALVCFLALTHAASLITNSSFDHDHELHMDILMKGAKPEQHDAYLCTSYEVNEDEAYIVQFEALANADTAHHILLYGCTYGPASTENIWNCPRICQGGPQQIMFAWAKNAPATKLPKGVGLRIGRKTSIRTIVLQVHYAKSFQSDEEADKSGIRLHMTREKQPYVAGIYLLMSVSFAVPPQTPKYHVDMSCKFNGKKSIFPFAYRTHAHGLGRVITGYQYNDTGYHMIGKGNPQWPQAFYPANNSIEVKPGDKLVARCTYNSTGTNNLVRVGATGNDEMCNFYIMFYTDSSVQKPSGECMGIEYQSLVEHMPVGSDVTLPPNPLLDEMAHGHHHHHHASMTHTEHTPVKKPAAISGGGHQVLDKQPVSYNQETWLDLPVKDNSAGNRLSKLYFNQNGDTNRQAVLSSPPSKWDHPAESLAEYSDLLALEGMDPINIQKRMGGEYYDDYSANDEREQGVFPDNSPGLSRNRNKAFEAMNQELKGFQHIKPPGEAGRSHWQNQYPQTSTRKKIGSLPNALDSSLEGGQPAKPEQAPKLEFQQNWPNQPEEIGQVGGVATDIDGNVYIFHRGERVWDQWSFDFDHNFNFKDQPIKADTIVIYSREGKLIRKFGSGMFFMPHGIEVDGKGNIWLTDVALHQVFRIPPGGTEPDLTLGERFVHFDDESHFCKPTDVAVLESGEFFVADGYCHSRILKFSKGGSLLKYWGKEPVYQGPGGIEPGPGAFAIPHSVTVSEELQMVCVADRENGRVQCFDLVGNFLHFIKYPQFGTRLFAVEYCPQHGGLLFAVNGPDKGVTVQGFTISVGHDSHRLLGTWNIPGQTGLQNPHDVAVDVKGHAVYVGELNPAAVWKFQGEGNTSSMINTTASHPSTITNSTTTEKSLPGKKSNITPSAGTQDSEEQARMGDSSGIDLSKNDLPVEGEVTSDFTPSIIIGVLLVIPVVLLLVITLVMRVHYRGWNTCFSNMRTPKVFTMQNFLGNSHKGFDKVSQDDSDHDADVLSDSDNEEFRQPMKSKA